MTYPAVMTEAETLAAALGGMNLARYGDGELSLCIGGDCVSQVRDKGLAAELKRILRAPRPGVLPCIPNALAEGTKPQWREKFTVAKWTQFYRLPSYGSSFITRPDSAPWIDTPNYWTQVESLWRDRIVVLVKGTERSLRLDMMESARLVMEVDAPRRDAWSVARDLERRIVVAHADAYAQWMRAGLSAEAERDPVNHPVPPPPVVLLCVGATSTVLADWLAAHQIHAVDAGHIGMFLRHKGSYAVKLADLISPEYRDQLRGLRAQRSWGGDGFKHASAVDAYAVELKAETVLDYGCGEQTLAAALKGKRRVMGYDPGVAGREGAPKPCDLVVSTDVLEHVEPDKLSAVLRHMHDLTGKGAYVVIALRAANAKLPDGRNAHLIVEPWEWWRVKLVEAGFAVVRYEESPGREVKAWLRK